MLVDLANERGGEDNITIIVLGINAGSAALKTPVKSAEGAGTKREIAEPVTVEYDTDEFSGKALIKSITEDGLFLETSEIFSIGQKLTLMVSDKNGENSVAANATVVGRKPRGIEIKYENLTGEQKSKIELFTGKKEIKLFVDPSNYLHPVKGLGAKIKQWIVL